MKRLLLVLFALTITFGLSAQKKKKKKEDPHIYGIDTSYDIPKGIKKGKKAPSFTAYTIEAEALTLKDLIKDGPVVVMFYRGEWCGYCNKFLANISDSLDYITDTGARVVAISPQQPYGMEKTLAASKTKVQLLEDRKGVIMEAFDVEFKVNDKYKEKLDLFRNLDLSELNMNDEAMLPVPATFVIDQKGIVRYKHMDINYANRLTALEIKKAIDEIKK